MKQTSFLNIFVLATLFQFAVSQLCQIGCDICDQFNSCLKCAQNFKLDQNLGECEYQLCDQNLYWQVKYPLINYSQSSCQSVCDEGYWINSNLNICQQIYPCSKSFISLDAIDSQQQILRITQYNLNNVLVFYQDKINLISLSDGQLLKNVQFQGNTLFALYLQDYFFLFNNDQSIQVIQIGSDAFLSNIETVGKFDSFTQLLLLNQNVYLIAKSRQNTNIIIIKNIFNIQNSQFVSDFQFSQLKLSEKEQIFVFNSTIILTNQQGIKIIEIQEKGSVLSLENYTNDFICSQFSSIQIQDISQFANSNYYYIISNSVQQVIKVSKQQCESIQLDNYPQQLILIQQNNYQYVLLGLKNKIIVLDNYLVPSIQIDLQISTQLQELQILQSVNNTYILAFYNNSTLAFYLLTANQNIQSNQIQLVKQEQIKIFQNLVILPINNALEVDSLDSPQFQIFSYFKDIYVYSLRFENQTIDLNFQMILNSFQRKNNQFTEQIVSIQFNNNQLLSASSVNGKIQTWDTSNYFNAKIVDSIQFQEYENQWNFINQQQINKFILTQSNYAILIFDNCLIVIDQDSNQILQDCSQAFKNLILSVEFTIEYFIVIQTQYQIVSYQLDIQSKNPQLTNLNIYNSNYLIWQTKIRSYPKNSQNQFEILIFNANFEFLILNEFLQVNLLVPQIFLNLPIDINFYEQNSDDEFYFILGNAFQNITSYQNVVYAISKIQKSSQICIQTNGGQNIFKVFQFFNAFTNQTIYEIKIIFINNLFSQIQTFLWGVNMLNSVVGDIQQLKGLEFSYFQAIQNNSYFVAGDQSGILALSLIKKNMIQSIYTISDSEINLQQYINNVQQSLELGLFFIIKQNIVVFNLFTNEIIETIEVETSPSYIENFYIMTENSSIIALKKNFILLKNYQNNQIFTFNNQQTVLGFIVSNQTVYAYGSSIIVLNLNLTIIQSKDLINAAQSCIISQSILFCKMQNSEFHLYSLSNLQLLQSITSQYLDSSYLFSVDDQYKQIYLYTSTIEIYTEDGNLVQKVTQPNGLIYEIQFFQDILIYRNAGYVTICQRNNFQKMGQIVSVGGGRIKKFFFIQEYYHLVFFTTNIRFSQISSYNLNNFQTVMSYTCIYSQNDCTVIVDAQYDRDQNYIILIDMFGSFQAVYYSGVFQGEIILKIPDFTLPKFNNLQGFSVDLRTNYLLVYNSLSVFSIPYGDLSDYMKQIQGSKQNLFTDLSFQNQDLQNNTYIILGEQGFLYKYQQAKYNFFYNFDEEVLQIQYNQKQQILINAFLDKIVIFYNLNQTSIQQNTYTIIQKQEILLNGSQFSRFLCQDIFITTDQIIWHYNFFTKSILYKFSVNNQAPVRISSDLFSATSNILLLGLSNGDLIIYNLIELQEKRLKIGMFDKYNTASISISYIKETQNSFFICYSNGLGVYQISKDIYSIKQILRFQDIKTYQIIQDSAISIFEVDEKFSTIYLNFVSERIVRKYQYDQTPLTFQYVMLSKRQQNRIYVGNSILIFYSSASLLIYDRQTLKYLTSIRRLNDQYYITDVKLLEDQYLLIISQQRVEFFILTTIQYPQLVDQFNITSPIVINFQIQISQNKIQGYLNPKIIFVVILGENQIIEKRYSLDYEEQSDEQKYCYASFQVQDYFQFLKELSQVKPQTYPSSTQIDLLANPNSSSFNYLMVKYSNQNMFPLDNSNTKNSSIVFYSSQISTPFDNNQGIAQMNVNNYTLLYNQKQDVYFRDFQIVFNNNNIQLNNSQSTQNLYFQNLYFISQDLTNITCSFSNLKKVVFKRFTFFNSQMGNKDGKDGLSFYNLQNIQELYIYDFIIDNNLMNKTQFSSLLTANNINILVIKNLTIKNSFMQQFISIYNVEQLFIENINIINCQFLQIPENQYIIPTIFMITGVQTTIFESITMINCLDLSLILSLNTQFLVNQQVNFKSDTIILKNVTISYNNFSNYTNSAILFIQNSYVSLINVNYQKNQGNIYISNCVEFDFNQSFLSNNQNQDGGALFIYGCLNQISLSNISFISNRAFASGGAIFIQEFYGNFSIQVSSTIFKDNTALIGGGIRIQNKNIDTFDFNFWNQIKLAFINNTAEIYGNNFTTFLQDIYVSLPQNKSLLGIDEDGNNTLQEFRVKNQLTNIENALWYGVAVIDNFRSGSYFILQLCLIDLEQREFTYSPYKLSQNLYPLTISQEITQITFKLEKVSPSSFISITGQDIITHQQYIETSNKYIFKQVEVTSLPSSQQHIQISYILNSYQKVQNKPILVKLNLRKCQTGEIVKQISKNIFSCFQCPIGFYSLDEPSQPSYQQNTTDSITNSSNQIKQCNNCPSEAFFCQKNIIQLKNGYWRANEYSTEIIQCNSIYNACQGQDSNSKSYCGSGHIGPICRECDYLGNIWYGKKFSKSLQNELKCSECLFLYLQVTLTFLIFLSFLVYLQLQMIIFMNSFMQLQTCYYLRVMKIIPIFNNSIKDQSSFYLKILINFTQISSILVAYQNSIFPDIFSLLPSFLGSPTSSIMISISCLVSQLSKSEIDRIQTLQILQTILPFVLSQNLQDRQNKEKKSLKYWKQIFKNIQVLIQKQAFEQINQNSTSNYLNQTQSQTLCLQSIRNFQASFIYQKTNSILNYQNQSIFSLQNENTFKRNYEFQNQKTQNENTHFNSRQTKFNEMSSSESSKSSIEDQKNTIIQLQKNYTDKSSESIKGLQDLDSNSEFINKFAMIRVFIAFWCIKLTIQQANLCQTGCQKCDLKGICEQCEDSFFLDSLNNVCIYQDCQQQQFFQIKQKDNSTQQDVCQAICDQGFQANPLTNTCESILSCSQQFNSQTGILLNNNVKEIIVISNSTFLVIYQSQGSFISIDEGSLGSSLVLQEVGKDLVCISNIPNVKKIIKFKDDLYLLISSLSQNLIQLSSQNCTIITQQDVPIDIQVITMNVTHHYLALQFQNKIILFDSNLSELQVMSNSNSILDFINIQISNLEQLLVVLYSNSDVNIYYFNQQLQNFIMINVSQTTIQNPQSILNLMINQINIDTYQIYILVYSQNVQTIIYNYDLKNKEIIIEDQYFLSYFQRRDTNPKVQINSIDLNSNTNIISACTTNGLITTWDISNIYKPRLIGQYSFYNQGTCNQVIFVDDTTLVSIFDESIVFLDVIHTQIISQIFYQNSFSKLLQRFCVRSGDFIALLYDSCLVILNNNYSQVTKNCSDKFNDNIIKFFFDNSLYIILQKNTQIDVFFYDTQSMQILFIQNYQSKYNIQQIQLRSFPVAIQMQNKYILEIIIYNSNSQFIIFNEQLQIIYQINDFPLSTAINILYVQSDPSDNYYFISGYNPYATYQFQTYIIPKFQNIYYQAGFSFSGNMLLNVQKSFNKVSNIDQYTYQNFILLSYCSVFNFYTWNLEKPDSINSDLQFYFGVYFSKIISRKQFFIFGDKNGVVGFNTISNQEYTLVYNMESQDLSNGDEIQYVRQNMAMGKYFIIKSNVLVYSLHTNLIIEKLDVGEPIKQVEQFEIIEDKNSILILKQNILYLKNYSTNSSLLQNSLGEITQFIIYQDQIFAYGSQLTILDYQLKISYQTITLDARAQDCILISSMIFCQIETGEIQFFSQSSLNKLYQITTNVINYQMAIDNSNQNIYLYNNLIQIYSIQGQFIKIIDLEQGKINELSFYSDIVACRTSLQITIFDSQSLNIRGSIYSQRSAIILGMYFIEEFYHLVIYTNDVQYGQIFSYDLQSFAQYTRYSNSYILDQKSIIVQIIFDKEQSFLTILDHTGNLQCVYYQQQVQLLNLLKIIELTPQSKAQAKGFSLDFKTNNMLIYSQYNVYQVSYGDLGNQLIQIQTRNTNIYSQLQLSNQNQLQNSTIVIAGEQGILYKYTNNQLKYFYNFNENITQIYYSSQKDYLLVALTTSIACFKKVSYQSILNQSGWKLNYTLQQLDNNKFVKFFTENLFLTLNNQIWHLDFEKQEVIFKFKLKNINDRITCDLYSKEQSILYLGISNGDFIIYDATKILIQTVSIQANYQQSSKIYSPIVHIVETQSSIWVSYLTQYGVYKLQKSNKQFDMVLDFSNIQTFQFQQDINVDIFGVDDVYFRFFINFATEQIVRVYNYQYEQLSMDYLILPKKQHSQLLLTENLIVFYSSSTLIIRNRSTLTYIQTIRRSNNYNFIKNVVVLEDTYFLLAYQSQYELISLNQDYSLQFIDQKQLSDPILVMYQIVQDQSSPSTNKILQVILLSMDNVQEFQYNLQYEVLQDQNKQCGVSMSVVSYLDMLQKIQNVKPFIQFDPTLQVASVSNIANERNQYMVTLQGSNLNIISYSGTQDNSLVISSQKISESGKQDLNKLIVDSKSFQSYTKYEINLRDFQFYFSQPILNITFSNQTKIVNLQNIFISNQSLGQIQFQFLNLQRVVIDYLNFSQNERINKKGQDLIPLFLFNNCSEVFIYNLFIYSFGKAQPFYSLLSIQNVTKLTIIGFQVYNIILTQLINITIAQSAFFSNVDVSNCYFEPTNSNETSSSSYVFNLVGIQNTNIGNVQFINNSNLQLLQTFKQYDNSVALYILQSDSINIQNLKLSGNNQSYQYFKPLILLQNTNIMFKDSNFQNNQGNVQFLYSNQVNISNNEFINNISEDGGSLQLIDCYDLINIQNTTFVKNQALASGGAIYIEDFYGTIYFDKNVNISNNKALIGGGMRIKNYQYNNEDQIWQKYKQLFSQNYASLYGNNFATYLTTIKIENNIQQSQFDTDINYESPDFQFLEKNLMNETEKKQWQSVAHYKNFKSGSYLMMNLHIFDIEGNIFRFSLQNLTQNIYPSQIEEEIKSIYFKIEENNQSNISINGQNIVTYEQFVEDQSLFAFSQVIISSIPTYQKQLLISYSISLQDNQNFKPILLLLDFRACKVGEILKQADSNSYNCEQCQLGYYSLDDPTSDQLWQSVVLQEKNISNATQVQCIKCPDSANSCQSNQIQIKDGYWRANNKTSEIIQCNQNVNSCKPNDPQSQNGCSEGYIGPICSVCDVTGKYWNGNRYINSFIDDGQCEQCSSQKYQLIFIGFTFLFLCLYFLISAIMFVNNFVHYQICQYLRLMQIIPIYRNQIRDQSIFYLKIFMNYIQINSIIITHPFSVLSEFLMYFPAFLSSPNNRIIISLSCIINKNLIDHYGYTHIMQFIQAILPHFFLIIMAILIKILEKLKLFGIKHFHLFTMTNFIYMFFQPNQINFFSKQLTCIQVGSNKYVASDLDIQKNLTIAQLGIAMATIILILNKKFTIGSSQEYTLESQQFQQIVC
ncbi:hypothetical protein ABPG74_003544 [Tetrahymena malaccensis]